MKINLICKQQNTFLVSNIKKKDDNPIRVWQASWKRTSESNFIQTWRTLKKTEGKGNDPSAPTEEARHETGGIDPHILTTLALDADERLVSGHGCFTPEELASVGGGDPVPVWSLWRREYYLEPSRESNHNPSFAQPVV